MKSESTPQALKREEAFHNHWAKDMTPAQVLVNESFESATTPENRQIMQWLGDVRGKKVLDLGCGAGEAAVYLAKQGARVTACDLSEGMITLTQAVARYHRVTVTTFQAPSRKTGLLSNSFDIVYAANLIHHVEINHTLSEIQRLLRPGGVAVFWDPLKHNPLINIYRRIAQHVRTADERPLDIKHIEVFKQHFSEVKFECFWLLTLWIFVSYFLIERINPNQERYWKKIISDNQRHERLYNRLEKIDRALLRNVPFLKRYCWNIVIYGKK